MFFLMKLSPPPTTVQQKEYEQSTADRVQAKLDRNIRLRAALGLPPSEPPKDEEEES